ncbi:hypothetical protein OHB12_32785 [Nocardia sp. NBC_01730]|nr:hypothetical protein OHB12_32785 [Nocardia sp. NBC_01730]
MPVAGRLLRGDDFVLPQRLTDHGEDGGLFGLRFRPPWGETTRACLEVG